MDNFEKYVPEGAIVVRLNENLLDNFTELHFRRKGSIFKTVDESKSGGAYYTMGGLIHTTNWRYASALEIYCFNKFEITNVEQITRSKEQDFKTYLNNKKHGNTKNDLPRVETTESNGFRPTAIGIRKPTKQIAIGIRPIGNATKGKRVKERIESFTLKTEAIKF